MEYFYIGVIICLIIIIVALIVFLNRSNYTDNSKYFRNIFNSIKQSILLFNDNDELIFINKHARETLKLSNNHLHLPQDQLFKHEKMQAAFKNKEQSTTFDINYEGKIYLINYYPIITNNKKSVRSIIILNNVTEARKIEQTKKDFFSNASHELKSPLTAILGYSELVELNMVGPEEYEDIINRIYNQALHMSLLVEDMSVLSRLETITDDIKDRKEVFLNDILDSTLYTLDPFIEDKKIKVKLKNKEKIKFNCIPLDINKLFKNLIENAIKYSPHNKEIEISLYTEDNEIIFIVEDNGIGISNEHVNRIFERFYRVDKGRIEPGTGLGLAIVKHTVLKYNGNVLVDSKLGQGTTITVKLPLNK